MRLQPVLALVPALAALGLAASARAGEPAARSPAPVIRTASPAVAADDRPVGRDRRVTFSPDGDGRHDVVTVHVLAIAGHALSLWLHPASRTPILVPIGTAAAGVTTVRWDGLRPDGTRYADGSYVLRVCDRVTQHCSHGRVFVHLRLVTLSVAAAAAVSPGAVVRATLSSDRRGPFVLDLVPAGTDGPGLGASEVAHAGSVRYRVPDVPHGGLWLLRARDGAAVTHFPLVVHQPGFDVAAPPPHTALVVYPYLTWRAYDMADENRDGVVDSWYAHPRTPVVPLYGPFEPPTDDPALEGREPNPESQDAFAVWLARHDLTAEHVTDVELGTLPAAVLARYPVIVFEGHTEYYERATYAKVLAYRNAGGRLYFLQGNSFYGAVEVGRTTVFRASYRYRTAARSDFAVAATGFRSCCWPAPIRPVYHVTAAAAAALPWLFAGTGLRPGDPFGIALGEVDTVDAKLSPPGTVTVATATVPPFRPVREKESYAWVGSRPIPYEAAWRRPQTIAIAYARTGAGEVFSWGNTGFLKSIASAGYGVPAPERAALDRAALNVWERFTQ